MNKTSEILEKVKALKYKDDFVCITDVYPSVLEEAFHFIHGIEIIGGRDLDYEGETSDLYINGSAYYGKCTITKKNGDKKPKSTEKEPDVYKRASFMLNGYEVKNIPPAIEITKKDIKILNCRKDMDPYYVCFNHCGVSKMTLFYAKNEIDVRHRALSIWGSYDEVKTGDTVRLLKEAYRERFDNLYKISDKVYVLEEE